MVINDGKTELLTAKQYQLRAAFRAATWAFLLMVGVNKRNWVNYAGCKVVSEDLQRMETKISKSYHINSKHWSSCLFFVAMNSFNPLCCVQYSRTKSARRKNFFG